MADAVRHGEAYRSIRLCVDEYERGEIRGRLYHPALREQGRAFENLTQLLVAMEALMNEEDFPQSYTTIRAFSPLPADWLPPAAAGDGVRYGKRATFVVRLMFRQHTSWQGSVAWVEGKGEQAFRSALELVLLMNSAMAGKAARA